VPYCQGCGNEVHAGAVVCVHCGRQQGPTGAGGSPMAPIPNYLVQSILATLFCCMPLGIVSIVYAAQVNTKQAAGDYAGALNASKQAKLFAMISAGAGLVVGLFYVLFGIMGALGSSA
jgi:hypothetical protein